MHIFVITTNFKKKCLGIKINVAVVAGVSAGAVALLVIAGLTVVVAVLLLKIHRIKK